jgi:hypothetical protein
MTMNRVEKKIKMVYFVLRSKEDKDSYLSSKMAMGSLSSALTFKVSRLPGSIEFSEYPSLPDLEPVLVCSGGCNEPNGICLNGQCKCNEGYEGETCGKKTGLAWWKIVLIVLGSLIGIFLLVFVSLRLRLYLWSVDRIKSLNLDTEIESMGDRIDAL